MCFECSYLSFGCEIGHRLTMYVTRGVKVFHPKCLQIHTEREREREREGCDNSCLRTYIHYLFACFCHMMSYFICRNLTLPSFKTGVCKKGLFFFIEINFCCNEKSLFYFKLLFRIKVSLNGFNFYQTEF